jgi:hypothetical protein
MEVTKRKGNQVEDSIMHVKEWTREFGRCNPVEHADTKQKKGAWSALEKVGAKRCSRAPRLVGPGRSTSPFYSPPSARLPQVSL